MKELIFHLWKRSKQAYWWIAFPTHKRIFCIQTGNFFDLFVSDFSFFFLWDCTTFCDWTAQTLVLLLEVYVCGLGVCWFELLLFNCTTYGTCSDRLLCRTRLRNKHVWNTEPHGSFRICSKNSNAFCSSHPNRILGRYSKGCGTLINSCVAHKFRSVKCTYLQYPTSWLLFTPYPSVRQSIRNHCYA